MVLSLFQTKWNSFSMKTSLTKTNNMKDLLEVIEEGRKDFVHEPLIKGQTPEDWLTSHTKAILTNQIERMKGEILQNGTIMKVDKLYSAEYNQGYFNGNNLTLQTQIDYLEDIVSKLT